MIIPDFQLFDLDDFNEQRCENLKRSENLFVAIDHASKNCLYFSNNPNSLISMQDSSYDFVWRRMNVKNKIKTNIDFFEDPWNYYFEFSNRNLYRYPEPEKISPDQILKFQLLNKKFLTINYIDSRIKMILSQWDRLDSYQMKVYEDKFKQSQLVKSGETNFLKTFYVYSWSELRGIPLDQAADEIIFKNEELSIDLYFVEHLRLKYTLEIKKSTDLENIDFVIQKFEEERYLNGRI